MKPTKIPLATYRLQFGEDLRFADAWGPAWRFAAQAGLSPYGPLILPGRWIIS